jgi:hypothetical protein
MCLLDQDSQINLNAIGLCNPLKKRCKDPKKPTRREIDPAAKLTHTTFEKGHWKGFPPGHSLHQASAAAIALFKRVVDARHTLIYRPMLLKREGWYWEDCELIDDMARLPDAAEVERVYRGSCTALADEFLNQWKERQRLFTEIEAGHIELDKLATIPNSWAIEFFDEILEQYQDTKGGRPTEAIILSYARLLQGNSAESAEFLRKLVAFQDELLNLCQVRATLQQSPALAATG